MHLCASKAGQGWSKIDRGDWVISISIGDARPSDDQRHSQGRLVQHGLPLTFAMLAQVVAIVRSEDDDRGVQKTLLAQRRDRESDLVIQHIQGLRALARDRAQGIFLSCVEWRHV